MRIEKGILTTFLMGAFFMADSSRATIIEANGFPTTTDCGYGMQDVKGTHTATINLVSSEDLQKTWFLTGRLWKCDTFLPREVSVFCTSKGSTVAHPFLECTQMTVEQCEMIKDGIFTRTTSGITGGGNSDADQSNCVVPVCRSTLALPPSPPSPSAETAPGAGDLFTNPEYLEMEAESSVPDPRFRFRLGDGQLPRYTLAANFFRRASIFYELGTHSYHPFLNEIGIEPESPAAEFFAKIRDEAHLVLMAPTVDPDLGGRASEEGQLAELRKKAARLGVVYRQLLAGLEDAGVDIEAVEGYLEVEIRPGVDMVSSKDDDFERFLAAVAVFEQIE